MLGIETRGHVLHRHHHANDGGLLTERAQGDPLLHAIEVRGRDARRAGNEIVMEGRRQHLHFAGLEDLLEPYEQPALGDRRHDRDQRPTARVRRGDTGRLLHPPIPRADRDGRVYGEDAERRGGLCLRVAQWPLVRAFRPLVRSVAPVRSCTMPANVSADLSSSPVLLRVRFTPVALRSVIALTSLISLSSAAAAWECCAFAWVMSLICLVVFAVAVTRSFIALACSRRPFAVSSALRRIDSAARVISDAAVPCSVMALLTMTA